MAKVLTLQMYKRLRVKATKSGFTLDDIIQPGVDNPDNLSGRAAGCVAGDEESYDVFREFFDPLIELCHPGYQQIKMHRSDMNPENFKGGADFDEQYVLSCRICTGRNVEDYSFPPHCSRGERRALEKLAIQALIELSSEFNGTYYSLNTLGEEEQKRLTSAGILHEDPLSPLMVSSGMARDWPDARGVWHNNDKNFIVWVNKEDHLRIISMQQGGNMTQVFQRYCFGLKKLEEIYRKKRHPFIFKYYLGYVLTCPSELGTGLRASVHLKLDHISKHQKFSEILQRLRLERHFIGDTHTSAEKNIYSICNSDTIGFTEVELLQMVVDGIKLLITMDKCIEQGAVVDDLIPAQK
ncbi:creatine kinase M-type isoform X2 [Callorhinchus milii]|nr:creatine kinase M-type isoform X2 [Callorhinchus milii]